MKLKQLASATVAMTAALAFGAQAMAQTPPVVTGPVLPGVCVFDPARAIGTSTVGKYLSGRINEIRQQVNAELQADDAKLAADAKALQAQQPTLPKDQFDRKVQDFQGRENAFRALVQQRDKELQQTESNALQQVAAAMEPVVQQTFEQRRCSVLLTSKALYEYVPGAEVTDSIIAGLNVKLQSLPIELVHEQQPVPGARPAR